MCLLVAPEVVGRRIPNRVWGAIGLMVAAGVFVGAGLVI